MHLAGVHLEPIRYALRLPLRMGGQALTERRGFRIRLRDETGPEGWGEALPLPDAGTEDLSEAAQAISDVVLLCNEQTYGLSGLLDLLEERLPHAPATRCAFDVAAHQLEAKLDPFGGAARLAPRTGRPVRVEARVDDPDPGKCLEQARAAVLAGHRTLAIGVGTRPQDEDLSLLYALREALGPEIRLRLDPAARWSVREALARLEPAAALDVEFVVQPLALGDLAGLAELHAQSPVPVAIDASLATPAGRDAFLEGKIAAVALISPVLLGGLRPSLRLARRARAPGLRSLIAAPGEGTIGTRAALGLAAAVEDSGLDHRIPGADALVDAPPDCPAAERGCLCPA